MPHSPAHSGHGSARHRSRGPLGVTKQSLGRTLTALESHGLVATSESPDRRERPVVRTPEGDAASHAFDDAIAAAERGLAAQVGERRYRQLTRILRELAVPD